MVWCILIGSTANASTITPTMRTTPIRNSLRVSRLPTSPIVALNELPRRLEDVYLEIVAGNDRTTASSERAHQLADTSLVDQPMPEMAESR
jgi:hypothetical protein